MALYRMDRKPFKSLFNLVQQRHTEWYNLTDLSEEDRVLLQMKEWVFVLPCCVHDIHNSLIIGLCGILSDYEVQIKQLYNIIEALRNSYDAICSYLPTLFEHLHFRDSGDSEVQRRKFWTLFEFEDHILNILVMLDIRYEGGQICLGERMRAYGNLYGLLFAIYLAVFKFSKFSATRWLGATSSCKTLVAAWKLGIHELCEGCRREKLESEYYLHGFFNDCAEIRTAWEG